jgi:copper chaperone
MAMETLKLNVRGMHCGGCVASVTRVLKAVPGVSDARVQLQPGGAEVDYDPAKVAPAALASAVEDAGFEAVPA